MKRNLIRILSLVVISLMCNATSAFAPADAKANVPFAFNVGKGPTAPWEPAGYWPVADRLPHTDARSISTGPAKTYLVANAAGRSSKRARLDLAPRLLNRMRHSGTQRRR